MFPGKKSRDYCLFCPYLIEWSYPRRTHFPAADMGWEVIVMLQIPAEILAMSAEPALLAKNGKILFANAAACALFG